MSEQLKHWRICQVCGTGIAASKAEADGWLVGPYKRQPAVMVVRCYRHISEWSLRNSVGRTNEWRRKMVEGRARAAREGPSISPMAEPFPLSDRPL